MCFSGRILVFLYNWFSFVPLLFLIAIHNENLTFIIFLNLTMYKYLSFSRLGLIHSHYISKYYIFSPDFYWFYHAFYTELADFSLHVNGQPSKESNRTRKVDTCRERHVRKLIYLIMRIREIGIFCLGQNLK